MFHTYSYLLPTNKIRLYFQRDYFNEFRVFFEWSSNDYITMATLYPTEYVGDAGKRIVKLMYGTTVLFNGVALDNIGTYSYTLPSGKSISLAIVKPGDSAGTIYVQVFYNSSVILQKNLIDANDVYTAIL